jgi:hypothetical protein
MEGQDLYRPLTRWVRSHAGRAIEAGAARGEVEHVVALAVTTAGFPTAVAAFTWVEDILKWGGAPEEAQAVDRAHEGPPQGAGRMRAAARHPGILVSHLSQEGDDGEGGGRKSLPGFSGT